MHNGRQTKYCTNVVVYCSVKCKNQTLNEHFRKMNASPSKKQFFTILYFFSQQEKGYFPKTITDDKKQEFQKTVGP